MASVALLNVAAQAQSTPDQPTPPPAVDAPAPATPSTPPAPPTPAAAPEATAILSELPGWTIEVTPRLWWVSPSGELRLPAFSSGATDGGGVVRVEDLNLDTPRASPMGEAEINTGDWRFTIGGANYSLDRSNTTADTSFSLGDIDVAAGDALGVSFDFTTIEASAAYRVWYYDFKEHTAHPADAIDAITQLYVIGGVRAYDVDISVRHLDPAVTGAVRTGSEQFFVEPIVGLLSETVLTRHFQIDTRLTGGAMFDSDRSSASLDVAVAFVWRPIDTVGVEIGWRQLAFWLSDGDAPREFEYNGRLAGLFLGVEIRF